MNPSSPTHQPHRSESPEISAATIERILCLTAAGLSHSQSSVNRALNSPAGWDLPWHPLLQRAYDLVLLQLTKDGVPRDQLPLSIADFIGLCHRPLHEWGLCIPSGSEIDFSDILLLVDGDLTSDAQEWFKTGPFPDLEYFENAWFVRFRRACNVSAAPQQSYVAIREWMIRHPMVDQLEFLTFKQNHDLALGDVIEAAYEPIPQTYIQDGSSQQCVHCGCPMYARPEPGCTRPDCRKQNLPQGKPIPLPNEGRLLHPALLRFLMIPGRTELDLYDRLRKKGCEVSLWPGLDQYDLRVVLPNGRTFAVDVKDWKNPVLLARSLRTELPTDHGDEFWYVFPSRCIRQQPDYVSVFKRSLPAALRKSVHAGSVSTFLKALIQS
ncbi:MAG: hypothetical protein JW706_05265 [Opitutales bacterium]|nr:hypothetical protein [Opitutales bacterium]